MLDIGRNTTESKTSAQKKVRHKKILNAEPGYLALVAYLVWLVTDMSQPKACRIVGASLFNLSVISGSKQADLDDYARGHITFREVTERYRLRNGNGEKLLARLGPRRVAEWLNTLTTTFSAEEL